MRPIGVALVGYGMAGRVFHEPLLTALPEFDLRAIADPRGPATSDPGSPRIVPDLATLLRDDDIELAVVATPNATHGRLASRALRAGRHVVVDKPFTPTVREADRLILEAKVGRRLLNVFHSRRWDDDYQTVASVAASGRLGRLHRYIARFEFRVQPGPNDWRRTPGPGSGLLYDVGSHLIDQAIVLLGRPQTVTARLAATEGRPDHAFTVVLECGGVEAVLLGSERTALPGPTFELHGDAGSLVMDGGRDGQEGILAAGLGPFAAIEPPPPPARLRTGGGPAAQTEWIQRARSSYTTFYQLLAGSIRDGSSGPVPAEAARETIRVIEAAQKSSRIGRRIHLA